MICCCWWCCHEPPGESLRLPYKYDKTSDSFYMMGQFCSWECMKAWNNDKVTFKTAEINQLITLLRKRTTGLVSKTKIAPSRYILKMFGGDMDIEEFRKNLNNKWIKLPGSVFTPIVTHKYEAVTDSVINHDHDQDSDNERDTNKEEVNLVLKRPIPIKRSKNDLTTMLGLKKRSIT